MALWAEQDPSTAASWIEGMANDGSKATAARALIGNWTVSNADAALEWVEQLPHGKIRKIAAAEFIQTAMEQSPETVADWAFKESTYQGQRELFVDSIRKFAELAPEAGANYLRDLQTSIDSPDAIEAYLKPARNRAHWRRWTGWPHKQATIPSVNREAAGLSWKNGAAVIPSPPPTG